MPSFRYQAITTDGSVQAGTLNAPDRNSALKLISQRGETPLEIEMSDADAAAVAGRRYSRPSISRAELADLVRELATALEAGLPLMQALRTVRKQAASKNLQAILDFVIERVEAGVTLHQAAKEYGAPFDDMTTGMLRAADASGRNAEIRHQLADLLERSVELRREIVAESTRRGGNVIVHRESGSVHGVVARTRLAALRAACFAAVLEEELDRADSNAEDHVRDVRGAGVPGMLMERSRSRMPPRCGRDGSRRSLSGLGDPRESLKTQKIPFHPTRAASNIASFPRFSRRFTRCRR